MKALVTIGTVIERQFSPENHNLFLIQEEAKFNFAAGQIGRTEIQISDDAEAFAIFHATIWNLTDAFWFNKGRSIERVPESQAN